MPLSMDQGETLTTLLHALRPDWSPSGIRAALKKASFLGSAVEVAVAACRCAADETMRTPFLISEPGPHWHGLAAGTRQAPIMCQTHPAHKAGGCIACFKAAVPMPDGFAAPRRDRHLKVWQAGGDGPWSSESADTTHKQPARTTEDEAERHERVRQMAALEQERVTV